MLRATFMRQPLGKPLASVAIVSPKGASAPAELPYPLRPQVVLPSRSVTSSDVAISHRSSLLSSSTRDQCHLVARTGHDCLAMHEEHDSSCLSLRSDHRRSSRSAFYLQPAPGLEATMVDETWRRGPTRKPQAVPRLVKNVEL